MNELPARQKIFMFYPHMNERAVEMVTEVLRSRWIGQAHKVDEFEQALREKLGIPFPVTVNSGTAAIHMALELAGVGPGDEVITTAMTCTATSHAILMNYAKPVFADIQYDTLNIDPNDIEHRITPKTKAIMVVHWGGYACDMDEINAIAKKHNIPVIEDAAHALGGFYKGQAIGGISDYTCFSLQAIKLITCGDGGLVCPKNKADTKRALATRWFSIDRANRVPSVLGHAEYDVTERGFKYHMNDISAAIGLALLPDVPKLIQRRKEIAQKYLEGLKDVPGITFMNYKDDRDNPWWLFTMHVERRFDFCTAMRDRRVEVSVVHYRNDIYTVFGPKRTDLPNVDKADKTMICLPIHGKLTDEEVDYVVQSIKKGW